MEGQNQHAKDQQHQGWDAQGARIKAHEDLSVIRQICRRHCRPFRHNPQEEPLRLGFKERGASSMPVVLAGFDDDLDATVLRATLEGFRYQQWACCLQSR